MSNATVYEADSGYSATSYSASTNMAASAIDIEGFVGVAGITREQIASGVFDGARVYIFKFNYLNPIEDEEQVTLGLFGRTELVDDRYRIEGASLIDVLGQSVGTAYSPLCTHTFGDAKCGKSLAAISVTGTLTGVTSGRVFRDSARTEADDWFGSGTIKFTSGANAGLKEQEIKSYALDGTITVFESFYYTPSNGDAYVMTPGCRKRKEDCRDKWDNVINAMAFWDMPISGVYFSRGEK
jgi:uncharacterized phage protein (TIGR02218 family)